MCYGLVLFGLLKGRHIDPCMTFEVTVIVTVKVTVKVMDLGEEERMLPKMLLREGVGEINCVF